MWTKRKRERAIQGTIKKAREKIWEHVCHKGRQKERQYKSQKVRKEERKVKGNTKKNWALVMYLYTHCTLSLTTTRVQILARASNQWLRLCGGHQQVLRYPPPQKSIHVFNTGKKERKKLEYKENRKERQQQIWIKGNRKGRKQEMRIKRNVNKARSCKSTQNWYTNSDLSLFWSRLWFLKGWVSAGRNLIITRACEKDASGWD